MSTGTNRGYRPGVALTLCALLTIAGSAFAKSSSATVAGNYGKLPLHFEENKGQADPSVRYLSRGSGYALLLGPQQATLSLVRNSGRAVVRLNFVGSSGASSVRAEGALPGSSNYFIGSDPSRWIHGSKHFGKVVYDSLYPGVNAVFYGNQKQLEYDLVVAPGADPKQIRLSFEGADALKVNANGDLVLSTAVGELIQKAPLVYQEIGKKRRTVRSHYVLEDGRVTFALAKYDVRRPLVIDPVLLYSSYLGGSGEDEVRGIALDTNRAAVLVGRTASNDFGILPNGLLRGTTDAFLIKLGVNGNTVINATYFGGAQDDAANAVALDAQGNVLVVGSTTSGTDPNKFPVTNTFQNQIGGAQDGFFIKFNAGTNAIAHATFIGGFGTDDARGVAVAPDGTAHVVGSTNSFNLGPFGAFQAVFGQGESDGFYFRFSPEGFRLSSSYLGGESADAANAVAVDSAGAAYITGETRSVSFPLTAGVFQNRVNGCTASAFNCSQFSDAFITKVAPGGATLAYSTYLGGDKNERGTDIAVDATFNAYVTGETDSANLPILGAFQSGYAGATDSFITKFNPTGTNRIYLSYYGGSGDDRARSIAVDPTGAAVVVGATSSTDLPLTNFFQPANGGGVDAFVTVVSPAGNMRSLSTYVGASDNDDARAVAVDANGNAYVAGQTSSATFPTLNPVQSSFAGVSDGFVFKMSNCAIGINPTGVTVGSGTAGGVITITGPSDCPWSASTNDNWITFQGDTAGVGPGFLTYAIQANIGVPRVGTITIGGQVFTVTQLGAPIEGCVFPPNPANLIAPDEGITGTFLIQTTDPTCQWTVTSNAPWLQPFPLSGTGQANIQYTVFPNLSTLVRTGDVLINAQLFRVTQEGSLLSQNQRLVALIYFRLFGRYPSQSEIDFQVAQIQAGTPRADLIMNFTNTPEFNQGARFIAGLYYGILGRDPEFNGWLFQRNALARGLVDQRQLVANFLNSSEYLGRYGVLSDADFVRRLYANILGRVPSQAEVDFHVSTIPQIGRVQVATNFLNSAEFRGRIDARLNAFLLYATLLGRDATVPELDLRQSQLSLGVPLRTLVEQFIVTPEFTNQIL